MQNYWTVKAQVDDLPDGEPWYSTASNNVSFGAAEYLKIYNGTSTEWFGTPHHYGAVPSATQTGLMWYDATIGIQRIYKAAYMDPMGVAGWHSNSPGFELWTNQTGGYATPGMLVVADPTVSAKEFIKPTAVKDANVVGVVQETATDTSVAILAMIQGGMTVKVNVTTITHAVAVGDGLVANAGNDSDARSVGALDMASPNETAGKQSSGVPCGAFAVAMEALATATAGAPIKARLLGQVGQGRTIFFGGTEVASETNDLASANWDGNWNEIDLDVTIGGAAGTILQDAKHKPVLGSYFSASITTDLVNSSKESAVFEMGPNQSAVHLWGKAALDSAGSSGQAVRFQNLFPNKSFVPTTAGSPYTGLGQKVQWKGTLSDSVNTTIEEATLYANGYVY
jgi:hypothetical protein